MSRVFVLEKIIFVMTYEIFLPIAEIWLTSCHWRHHVIDTVMPLTHHVIDTCHWHHVIDTNGCSTPALKSSTAKQWIKEELAQMKEEDWHRNSALHDCGPRNWNEVNVCEILEVNFASFASKTSYCSKGAQQKNKSEVCSNVSYDSCIWLPAFFSFF